MGTWERLYNETVGEETPFLLPLNEYVHQGEISLEAYHPTPIESSVDTELAGVSGHLSRDCSASAGIRQLNLWPVDKVLRGAQVTGEPWPMTGPIPGKQLEG